MYNIGKAVMLVQNVHSVWMQFLCRLPSSSTINASNINLEWLINIFIKSLCFMLKMTAFEKMWFIHLFLVALATSNDHFFLFIAHLNLWEFIFQMVHNFVIYCKCVGDGSEIVVLLLCSFLGILVLSQLIRPQQPIV